MNNYPPENLDDFGENRLLSRLNRRFSSLIRRLFRLPETWTEEPAAEFRRFLSRLNLAAFRMLVFLGVFATAVCLILAIRQDSSLLFFSALAIVPLTFVTQFVVSLFCSANLDLTFGRPINLQSRLIPEVIAVFGTFGFLMLLASGIYALAILFQVSLHLGFLFSVLVLAASTEAFFVPWIAGNCEKLLNVRFEKSPPQGAADYLFSLVLFFARYSLALVPFRFALGICILVILGGYGAILMIVTGAAAWDENPLAAAALPWLAGIGISSLSPFLILLLLLPILAHFLFLLTAGIADLGTAFFRLVNSSETIANLSEEAMRTAKEETKEE